VWSDGFVGQFKSARAWYVSGRYHNHIINEQLLTNCQMLWNYFATRHGKGGVDGASALLKRKLHKEQIKP
jgi:hypothetical protein